MTASRSRLLRVYDWATATCRRSFKAHDGPTMAMQYHHSGRLLATGSSDSTVKVKSLFTVLDFVVLTTAHEFRCGMPTRGFVHTILQGLAG